MLVIVAEIKRVNVNSSHLHADGTYHIVVQRVTHVCTIQRDFA